MQELFRANGVILRGAVKSVTTFLGKDFSGSAALELFCFYKDEVLMRDCSVA
jgi:hypothetical protein